MHTLRRIRKLKACTLVIDNLGNDTPMKKPKTTPIKVVTISLMLSLGFLLVELHSNRSKCHFKKVAAINSIYEISQI